MINVEKILQEAMDAGYAAGDACVPTPVKFGQAASLFGNEMIPGTEEIVEDGVCGFAWINIKPARGKFVNYLKKIGMGRSDSYYGGYTVWVTEYGQSMERKEAYARAFAKVLQDYGMKAYGMSRMD